MRNKNLLLLAVSAVILFSCAAGPEQAEEAPPVPEKPPEVYQVKFETTKGDFVIEVHRDWAPRGADHFFHLVTNHFYDGVRFHRVIRRFIVQWGINGNPEIQSLYGDMKIRDDERKQSNKRGFVSFAKRGPNSRTTQVFINLSDNPELDKDGFVPFGQVVQGMDVVEDLWSSYGEVAPRGAGPDPTKAMIEGNDYFAREFPRLDSIVRATVLPQPAPAGTESHASK